jgi:hypothetical protein
MAPIISTRSTVIASVTDHPLLAVTASVTDHPLLTVTASVTDHPLLAVTFDATTHGHEIALADPTRFDHKTVSVISMLNVTHTRAVPRHHVNWFRQPH